MYSLVYISSCKPSCSEKIMYILLTPLQNGLSVIKFCSVLFCSVLYVKLAVLRLFTWRRPLSGHARGCAREWACPKLQSMWKRKYGFPSPFLVIENCRGIPGDSDAVH